MPRNGGRRKVHLPGQLLAVGTGAGNAPENFELAPVTDHLQEIANGLIGHLHPVHPEALVDQHADVNLTEVLPLQGTVGINHVIGRQHTQIDVCVQSIRLYLLVGQLLQQVRKAVTLKILLPMVVALLGQGQEGLHSRLHP